MSLIDLFDYRQGVNLFIRDCDLSNIPDSGRAYLLVCSWETRQCVEKPEVSEDNE